MASRQVLLHRLWMVNKPFDNKQYALMGLYDVWSWGEPRGMSGGMRYDC